MQNKSLGILTIYARRPGMRVSFADATGASAADLEKQRQAECYERGGQLHIHEPV
jgi:hypothetical protein